jgi:hypothetical protein
MNLIHTLHTISLKSILILSPSILTNERRRMAQRCVCVCVCVYIYIYTWSRGSSGSIVSDYGLDDRTVEVRSPTEAEDFSSIPCVQTGSGAHPASYPMGTGGSFPAGKARPGRDAGHSPPSSAEVKNE